MRRLAITGLFLLFVLGIALSSPTATSASLTAHALFDISDVTPTDTPIAHADSATTNEDQAVTIAVLANDQSLSGGALTIQSLTQPTGRPRSTTMERSPTRPTPTSMVATALPTS
jgi:hypothetical protein